MLTPNLNDTTARLTDQDQEAANTLKLVLPEGDIDFVPAAPVTCEPTQDSLDIAGRCVPLEPVVEILAKTLRYRAASLEPRNLFDLAVALARAPKAARLAIPATRHVHPLLWRRLATLRRLAASALEADIATTSSGQAYVEGMIDRVTDAIEQCA